MTCILSHTYLQPPHSTQQQICTEICTHWYQANLLWCRTHCFHKRWPATYLGVYAGQLHCVIVPWHTGSHRCKQITLCYICTLTKTACSHGICSYSIPQNDRDTIDACSQNGGHSMQCTKKIRLSITHTHTHTKTQQRQQQLLFSSWSII